ncbi:MAG: hypothetical protein KIT14_05050 [bacterium]|nr:hypothetical protein [bacterium]
MSGRRADEPVVHVVSSRRVTSGLEDTMVALFAATHHDADPDHPRALLRRLGRVALAFEGRVLVGFALGERRRLDLPRLPAQEVQLVGLACVAEAHRRRGLVRALGTRVVAGDEPSPVSALVCGRVAHPTALGDLPRLPGAVPQVGRVPSAWHRDVGRALATVHGAERFDPATFVCRGRGRPIGAPRRATPVTPDAQALFAAVDPARGDSLLALAWTGAAPRGW